MIPRAFLSLLPLATLLAACTAGQPVALDPALQQLQAAVQHMRATAPSGATLAVCQATAVLSLQNSASAGLEVPEDSVPTPTPPTPVPTLSVGTSAHNTITVQFCRATGGEQPLLAKEPSHVRP